MKQMTFNKNSYKESCLHNGWKYRMNGTAIIGINDDCTKTIIKTFTSFGECKKEFNRLTGKPKGRPKNPVHTKTCKGDLM